MAAVHGRRSARRGLRRGGSQNGSTLAGTLCAGKRGRAGSDPLEGASSVLELFDRGSVERAVRLAFGREGKSLRTRDNIPIYAVRGWHVEMMKLAQRAVHLQEPAERFFSGVTMTIDESKIPAAQALMADFREQFVKLVQTDPGNGTYHFALQFFRLTKKDEPEKLAEQADSDGPVHGASPKAG